MEKSVCQLIRLCDRSCPIYGRWKVVFVNYADEFVHYMYDAQNVVDVQSAVYKADEFKGYTKIELVGFTVNDQYFLLEDVDNSGYDIGFVLYVLN